MSDLENRFGGISRLYGQDGFNKLKNAHVCVVGIGGVGSWTVEALVRSGVGAITLVDLDDICTSNTNRQLHAMDGNFGKQKIDAMGERCRLINPEVKVFLKNYFFSERTIEDLLTEPFDYLVDAMDSLKEKCLLIATCKNRKIPMVTVGGAGGKRFPDEVKIADLNKTFGDSLLSKVRKNLRKEYNFSRNLKRRFSIDAVFSPELPVFPDSFGGVCSEKSSDKPMKLDCQSGFGAITFVTGTFGFHAASCAIKKIAGGSKKKLSN